MHTYFCPSLGWGKTTDAGISTETLQTAEVPIVEKSKCIERMNQEELEAGDGSDQMKKAQKKLTLSKIDFLSSVIIIGLD